MFGSVLGAVGSTAGSAGLNFASGLASAHQQYGYSKKLATHRHQWEVSDLRRAGLNPILSAGGTPSVSPVSVSSGNADIASSMDKTSAAQLKNASLDLVREQSQTERSRQIMLDNQASKYHWESFSASVQAYKDRLLSRAYDKPYVQKVAPVMRAYSESGLPPTSAFQLFKLFK